MNITIKNFGPIREFEFDLSRNISLIYGKNNIGKSYAITAIYLLLKSFPQVKQESVLVMIFDKYFTKYWRSESTETLVKIFTNRSAISVEQRKFIDDIIRNSIAEMLEDWVVKDFFRLLESSYGSIDSLKNKFSNESFSISVQNEEFVLEIVGSPKPGSPRINVNFTPNYEQDSFNRFLNGEEIRDVIFKAVDKIFTNFRENNLAQYFIPAVRSGYYLGTSSFTNTLAQINQFRSELTSDTFKMPKVTVPVSDFILQLSGLSNSADSSAPGYIEIIREMESNLLEGAVIFNPDEGKLFYKSSVFDSSYDLSVVSSMVAEISLIAGYFKFVVNDTILEKSPLGSVNAFKQHPLIFIEEPEAHLHPEVQVKLMEYFVKLANLGVKIIITTHSDYMLGKLSNILIANEIDPEKVGSYLLKMGEKGSVGDSQMMRATKDGIEDHIFLETADSLYREKLRIME
jgi:hypothetical protein